MGKLLAHFVFPEETNISQLCHAPFGILILKCFAQNKEAHNKLKTASMSIEDSSPKLNHLFLICLFVNYPACNMEYIT